MYVIVCADTKSAGFGGLASVKGWVRPDPKIGGWLIFKTYGLAFQWAVNNLGFNKEWTIAPLFSGVAVAAPF